MMLRCRKHQLPDGRVGRTHADFNVVAQPCQAIHQFALQQVGEINTHHVGYIRLSDARAFVRFLLLQAQAKQPNVNWLPAILPIALCTVVSGFLSASPTTSMCQQHRCVGYRDPKHG